MFKHLFFLFFLVGLAGASAAQSVQDTLLVVPGKQSLYFYHVVTKGESLYGIARQYKLDPKALARTNNTTSNAPLKLFQLLKVPLDSNNLVQSAGADVSSLTPLYHKVVKGETLYHIGQMHDRVDAALLKKWNHLNNNEVKNGQYLIVGWLNAARVNTPAEAGTAPEDQATAPVVSAAHEASPEKAASKETAAVKPAAPANESDDGFLHEVIASENRNRTSNRTKAATDKAAGTSTAKGPSVSSGPAGDDNAFTINDKRVPVNKKAAPAVPAPEATQNKTVAAELPEAEKTVGRDTPVKDNPFAKMLDQVTHKPQNSSPASKPASVPSASNAPKPATSESPSVNTPDPTVMAKTNAATPAVAPAAGSDSGQQVTPAGSEFEQAFQQQTANGTKTETKKGAAGWFRSNVKSGSGRYYALCNELPRGTIVKVVNPISGKYVLAKVLDAIPRQKENYNLIIKLSDAAMGDLGVSQSRFWCEIQYAPGEAGQ